MMKKDLAQALGISASMVSRLAKQGMPTDSVDEAVGWRKRYLETGRMKDVRIWSAPPAPALGLRARLVALRALARASDQDLTLALVDWLALLNYYIAPAARARLQGEHAGSELFRADGLARAIHGPQTTEGDARRWFVAATDPWDMADEYGGLKG